MTRKPLPGPSRLSQILKQLRREPVPALPALRSLRLTYAIRNNHFGARHFVKEDLPRIAYSNPTLDIVLDRKQKGVQDILTPEMLLQFHDGSQHKIDMEKKWSGAIFTELLQAHNARSTASITGEQRRGGDHVAQLQLCRTATNVTAHFGIASFGDQRAHK